MRFFIPMIICFFALPNLQAQSLKAYLKAADEAMNEADYYTAYYHLKTALEIAPKDISVRYKYAEAARAFNAFAMADSLYQSVINKGGSTRFPKATLYLAEMKQKLGKYAEATTLYQTYLTEYESVDEASTKMAKRGLESNAWALENAAMKDSTIKIERLGGGVNTMYSEFSPVRDGDYLYYSSVRYPSIKEDEKFPKPYFSRVLRSKDITGEGEVLDSVLNDINRHTGHIAFSSSQNRIYYTLCDYTSNMDITCELFYREVDGDTWGEAMRLPEPINSPAGTTTQPNICYDDKLQKDILYFVSDREGGKGKLDIWYSIMNDQDSFSEPVNLGSLNTEEDDISPFYHGPSSSMIFSSNGRIGYGGFDVYRSIKTNGNLTKPENMGKGVNSSLDDVHFTLSDDEALGFVSSNRLGSTYLKAEDQACCFDIYQVELKPIKLTVRVETYDAVTLEPLPNVTIYLSENGEEVIVTSTGNPNIAIIDLDRNKSYSLLGELTGYDPDSSSFSTIRMEESQEIVQKLYMNPSQLVLEVRTFGARDRQPLPRVNVLLTQAVNGNAQTEYNPNGHKVYFTIDRDADFNLLATKKGYRKATLDFNSGRQSGKDTLVKELFLELGNLEDFLPLAIYFDNDHPDPKSKLSTSGKRYLETYDDYYGQKEFFDRKYADGNNAQSQEVDDFFENYLKQGKQEFESFLNILDQYLQEGLEFKIYLKGYASPLASNAYNDALGGRRINTIQNEFKSFKGGVLMQYFGDGALEVEEKSFGEETAPTGVSDDRRNTRLSIYSPAASKERRVEIIEIEKEQN